MDTPKKEVALLFGTFKNGKVSFKGKNSLPEEHFFFLLKRRDMV